MDYLDPKKEFHHRIVLMTGYVLVAVAIVIATLILLYQAYGFGLGKNGTVIQNGLTFFSSQPHPADIRLNGTLNKSQTNSRLVLPAGIYHVQLTRVGYRDWQRTIEVEGGDVQHFDYPFLFPKQLNSKKLAAYASPPGLATQSPDRRWLVVQEPGSVTNFQVYDLKTPAKPPLELSLPATALTKGTSERWQLEEWADDNKHVVLRHDYDGKSEFVLVDRTDAAQSLNLDTTLSAQPSKLTLLDKKYDQYYLYDATDGTLRTATLSDRTPKAVLEHVLAYQSYGSDGLLYVTDKDAPAGKVLVRLKLGDKTYPVRVFAAGSTYLLDLTKYSDKLYVVAGSANDNKAYIYKDPVGQLNALPGHALVPSQVLHVTQPNYVSFSTSAQFIVVENGTNFGVYDIENKKGYNYTTTRPLEAPMDHASWMDGDRLAYVSGGKLLVFDYDNTNQQTLVSANSAYLPAFAPNYKFLYSFAPPTADGQTLLNQTSLLIPADQ